MKTSQIISTAILFSLSTLSFAAGDDFNKIVDNNDLSLIIVSIESPSCNGGDNGSATVVAEGGQAPYSYNWNTFPNQTSPEAKNLSSGTYFVEVTDANGAVFFRPVYVQDPNVSVLTAKNTVTEQLDITATVTGENAPYTYKLNGAPTESQDISNLPIGLYTLVVSDANGCEMVQYIQVFELQIAPNGDIQKITSPEEIKNYNQEELKSKRDRHVEASNLIPINNENPTREILVTVSNR